MFISRISLLYTKFEQWVTRVRSVIKEADPQKWRFHVIPMLLLVMKNSQTKPTVSSWCVTQVMQSQPRNGVSCLQ